MISKTYSPQEIEDKWYQYWIANRYFNSQPNPDKEPYTIVIPPPNVTGVLHMGHMLNNTIQDILVRKARMEGKEACWVPGTDHASIATEAKVVAMLKDRGIEKRDLSRDEFLEYCWEWTHKYGGIILQQLRKLGASCDWDRTRFTMEPELYDSVIDVFIDLYEKGDIYRGHRMVNWDPQARTTVSDEEVMMLEVHQKLVYIRYDLEGQEGSVTIATTRPETIMADVAICVNPEDTRYQHLIGKNAIIPLIDRAIPIIADEYVEMEFGTGCLKVTPAHDANDYELGKKHNLPIIDLLAEDGTLNEKAQILVGEDRFVARKKITKMLEASGHLVKVEEYQSNVGHSERTNAVIEPRLSEQWFLKMEGLSKPALENVMDDTIQLIPAKFKNTYRHWMENVRDWNISRQLWWGHRIPAYYLNDGTVIVAKSKREALRKAQLDHQLFALTEEDLRQDEDVLDTWFSSWLWPISVFNGIKEPDNADVNYYYPTNDLVTAPEILFFWVARMIIAGYEYRGQYPFKNVYLTGIVRDKQGRKMSKSLGNSPDPIELIEQYGADGVRTGMLFSSPAGNDLPFDEKLVEQGRNFCNKIWNAFRLTQGWEVSADIPANNDLAIAWFDAKLNQTLVQLHDDFAKFRISVALGAVYRLIWNDFCSQYLEMVKPEYQQPIDAATYRATLDFFDKLMRLTHPFMPFITEEIWQNLAGPRSAERGEKESICLAPYPQPGTVDTTLLDDFDRLIELVTALRNLRNTKNISPKTALPLAIRTDSRVRYETLAALIQKLANVSEITFAQDQADGMSFLVRSDEFFVDLAGEVDVEAERETLLADLAYTEGFLASVTKKLSNERFVQNAKGDIVEKERQKQADAEAKIVTIREALVRLG